MHRLRRVISVCRVFHSSSGQAAAQNPAPEPERMLAEMRARLNLTAEQEAQLRPLVERQAGKLRKIFARSDRRGPWPRGNRGAS